MEENIADALKMAGSVLLFVMGLSIAILAFSQARESMDIVLSYSDRESLSIEGNPRFYYLSFFPKYQNLQDESSNEKQNLINLYNAVDNNGNLITKFKCKTIEYHDSGGRVRLVKFEI